MTRLANHHESNISLSTSVISDAVLLKQVEQGDIGALGVLHDRYAVKLLKFFTRCVPREDAEDMVQTLFLRVVQKASSFDGRNQSAKSWLYGIGVHLIQERRRSLRRFARALATMARGGEARHQESSAVSRDLARALEKISEPKRVVLILFEVEGFGCHEIAEIVGVPIGTVWTRLHHARRELRALFEEEP